MQTSSPSFEFIAKNLHLFGFDSPSRGFAQTVRELVENSVDACCRKVHSTSTGASTPIDAGDGVRGGIEIAVHVSVLNEMIMLEVRHTSLQCHHILTNHTYHTVFNIHLAIHHHTPIAPYVIGNGQWHWFGRCPSDLPALLH
ncbi:hypothetical protein EON63_07130 [archaeon]|nr:MAG: hypothetical protein EON63_07130 [archaeon]